MSPVASPRSEASLAHALRALLVRRAGGPVELLQTHLSWMLLTRELQDACATARAARPSPRKTVHSRVLRNLSALPMTDTELAAIAALANIGLSSSPSHG